MCFFYGIPLPKLANNERGNNNTDKNNLITRKHIISKPVYIFWADTNTLLTNGCGYKTTI